MKINIIGDGSAGQRHKSILDNMGHKCTVYGPQENNPLQHGECDAVVIASPPETHTRYLAHYWDRCHMLCEGPVTYVRPYDIGVKPEFVQMTASNWRYVPVLQSIARACRRDKPLNGAFWFDHDLRLWRPQSDYRATCYYYTGIQDINLHEVDMALWLMGPAEHIESTETTTGRSLGVDQLVLLMSHVGGGVSTVMSGWHAQQYTRGLRLVWMNGHIEAVDWKSPQDDAMVNKSYELMLQDWTRAILDDAPSEGASLLDGWRAYNAAHGVAI